MPEEEHHHHHHHHHHRKQILIWRIVGGVLLVAQVLISTLLAVSLIKIGILEQWLVMLIIIGLIVLSVVCIIPLFIKKKLSIGLRVICVVISLVTIVGGMFAFRYTDAFDAFLDKVSMADGTEEIATGKKSVMSEPFVVYISGSDSRTSVDDSNARSDVNIVMVVNPKQERILLATIPRDTYVQLHDTEGLKDKLTHAGLYGVEMGKNTIEDFLGISIDYTVKVSFETVVKVVDELDGIEIESDVDMTLKTSSGKKTCVYVKGVQLVDGDCALRFARERKTYLTGDLHRIENQQIVLTAIINRLSGSKDYLLKVPEILNVAGDSFETSFSRNNIIEFVRSQLANGTKWQVESMTLEVEEAHLPTYSEGEDKKLFVFIPREESVQKMTNRIKEYLNND